MLLIGPIAFFAYFVFVFASDQRLPFRRPATPRLRRKWLYGRALAATVLASGGTGLALSHPGLDPGGTTVVLVTAAVAAAGVLLAVSRHVRSSEWAYVRARRTSPRPVVTSRGPSGPERLRARLAGRRVDIDLG